MAYELRASSKSESDVERILQYYLEVNPRLAKEFLGELKSNKAIYSKAPEEITNSILRRPNRFSQAISSGRALHDLE